MMTYREALDYIYGLADFERTGRFAADAEDNVPRMGRLLALLGDPQRRFASAHVAGTKGKGSTAALIAAALSASGLRAGLYTSPDLHTFRERIQIDSAPIGEDACAALVSEVRAAVERLEPRDRGRVITFEVATALAFVAFARAGVTHAAIEVGLGGRLDPTNAIAPRVGIITAISLDHAAILGDTIAAIAAEKAGIIKPGMAVVTSARHPDALRVIAATCAGRGAALLRVGPLGSGADYEFESWPANRPPAATPEELQPPPFVVRSPGRRRAIQIALLGAHQRENATAALAALDLLAASGAPVTQEGARAGFLAARWPARMDVVGFRPWLVIDGAHNADSLARLCDALAATFAFRRLHLVFGTMRDKDIAGMARVIAGTRDWLGSLTLTGSGSPRALAPGELAALLALDLPTPLALAEDLDDAMRAALAQATVEDLVCVTGSLYLAGAALRWVKARRPGPLTGHIVIAGDDHS